MATSMHLDEDGDPRQFSFAARLPVDSELVLRWWRPSDLRTRVRMIDRSRAHLAPHFSWAYAHTRLLESAWLAELSGQRAKGVFHYAICEGKTPVGSLSVYLDTPETALDPDLGVTAEVTYWLAVDAVGRGIATRSLIAATGMLFENGVDAAYLLIDADNIASMRTARSAGYDVKRPATGIGEQVIMTAVKNSWVHGQGSQVAAQNADTR